MMALTRAALGLGMALLLSACLLTPGTFESTLDIRADRSFTFAYKGEVIASDPSDIGKGFKEGGTGDDDAPVTEDEEATLQNIAWQAEKDDGKADDQKAGEDFSDVDPEADDKADAATKRRKIDAIVAALRREKGFRSVNYAGRNKYLIDYVIDGTLDHGFVFPFNVDAEFVFPFIAIELRGDDRVRVKAPGYANGSASRKSGMGSGADDMGKYLDGTFTLTTDADIVSQNQEDGAATVAGKRQIRWTITPLTNEAPMAVVRFPTK
ncbi:hypothetical protein [Sphingobium algorifonticola]|uniref:DUF4852 domain-containing protein n=1 Tax=Sphingobium algorifonticola TaxID=2008318 RepID=A0A437JBH7_9SPHN|nr:hypothetical protein [Sphingobium algorifonticola]RVT43224.1 hypothetical protein ENE74_00865 [Sphingobium algorifonticola]